MKDEYNQQVTTEGVAGGIRYGQGRFAEVCPPLQPEEVHAALTVRLFGAKGVPQGRLSRHRQHPDRLSEPLGRDRARTRSTLYNASKSGRSASKKNAANRLLDQTIVAAADAKILEKRLKPAASDGESRRS